MRWTRSMCSALVWAVILVVGALAAPLTKSTQKDQVWQTQPQEQIEDTEANELEGLLKHEETKNTQSSPAASVLEDKALFPTASKPEIVEEVAELPQVPVNSLPVSSPQFSALEETPNVFPVPAEFPAFEQEMEINPVYSEEPEVDLSPRAVAEYLLVTKDFDGFNQALSDLIQSGVLSPSEVFQYKDTVSWQYEGLLNQLENTRRQYIQDMVRQDPLDYLTQSRPMYPDVGMSQNNLPMNNQPIDFPDLGIQTPDFNMQVPEFDMEPRNFGGIQAIPVAERRTERVQKLLLAKQQNLDGVLDVVLNEYYNQPQEEYNTDYLDNLPPNYDINDESGIEQLMEYLQQSLNSEEVNGAAVPSINEPLKTAIPQEAQEQEDVATELDALPVEPDNSQDSTALEETSGDGEDDRESNATKAKVVEPSS